MDPILTLLIGLTLLGALSPLLTFAALFQQKEWRLDRLREHLRREGWVGQLFGRIRPVMIGLYLVIYFFYLLELRLSDGGGPAFLVAMALVQLTAVVLIACTLLTLGQLILRKQRAPVWTSKALSLTATALVLDVILSAIGWGHDPVNVLFPAPLLVLLQPLIMVIAWLLWKPVDAMLKKRVMDRAMHLRSQMKDATVIGIAGSVGKTTVKDLIAHLTQDLKPLVTPAHVNTEMGVAQWLLRQPTSHENEKSRVLSNETHSRLMTHDSQLLVIEMGAYRKGEITLLCRIAQPTIGVMTALGSDHLALFGSEQNIIDANGELIAALPPSGHAFFYGDNDGCRQLAKQSPCPVTIAEPDASLKHPLQGRHNDANVSLAVAVARHLGVQQDRIAELLNTFRPQAHTFSIKTERGITLLDDTYNISPLSLRAALDWASTKSERPRVLLTSGLQESGSQESDFLKDLGQHAETCVERVIFTDAHGSDIFATAFGKPVELLNKNTERVAPRSLLLCVGRMPLSSVNRLLPIS